MLLLNLASAVAAVVLVGTYGGWSFGLSLMVALSIYFFRPSPGPFLGFGDLLSNAWNPHTPVLPFAVLLVLCARLGSGVVTVLPWIVLVASFVVQTHVGLVPCTAAVTATAALLYIARRMVLGRRPETTGTDQEGRPVAFWIHAAIWAFVLMWLLPLLEQLRAGSGGNLAHMVSSFGADSRFEETQTMATSFNALSYALWTAIELGARFPSGGPFLPPTDFDLSATVWSVLQLVLAGGGRCLGGLDTPDLFGCPVPYRSRRDMRGVLVNYAGAGVAPRLPGLLDLHCLRSQYGSGTWSRDGLGPWFTVPSPAVGVVGRRTGGNGGVRCLADCSGCCRPAG